MLDAVDQRKFVVIGALEAAAQVISMICVSQLPGRRSFQSFLLWNYRDKLQVETLEPEYAIHKPVAVIQCKQISECSS